MATKHLELVLKGEWYDKIESGDTHASSRQMTDYWLKRIVSDPMDLFSALTDEIASCVNDMVAGNQRAAKPVKFGLKHATVRFRRGYGKSAPAMVWKIGHLASIVTPPAEVQAEVGAGLVIRIDLLERIS